MPELPDVAVFKRYLDATALHQEIESVDVRDRQVLAEITPQALALRLTGLAFSGTRRHGKYLFAQTGNAEVLVLHFGMTGRLAYFQGKEKEPSYTQALFTFRNDYHLAYVMPRKLGELRLVRDVDAFVRGKGLGPDVLEDDFDFSAFKEALSGRRAMVKTTLMNQEIMAGIGNVYSDEILFQARLHPRITVDDLDEETLHTVFRKLKSVLHTAIEHDANPEAFPSSFLTPHRQEGDPCPACEDQVERVKVSGRSAYYCPSCQNR